MSKSQDLCSRLTKSDEYKVFENSKKELIRTYDSLKGTIDNYVLDLLSRMINIEVDPNLSTVEKIKVYAAYGSGSDARKFIRKLDEHIQKQLPELHEEYKVSDYLKRE